MSAQPWYQGGYRANIVAYTIAKLAHDVADLKRAVDFEATWRQQSPGSTVEDAITIAAARVHAVLVEPPAGISNVTEWAKKQACWERVRNLDIDWPDIFIAGLISAEEQRNVARTARREQRELNGIEAQIVVVNAGAQFWLDALEWGKAKRLLSPAETGILGVAARVPSRTPTDKQSFKAIEILGKLNGAGYSEELPASS